MIKEDPQRKFLNRTWSEWLFTLPIFAMLLLTLVIGTGELFHGQLLRFGESLFGQPDKGVQYFMLRADPVKPSCDANPDIEAEVQRQTQAGAAKPADDIDALFGDTKVDPEVLRQSLRSAAQVCRAKHEMYERIADQITPQVKVYRAIETSFFALFQYGTDHRPMILLVMLSLAAIITTLGHHHICIRPARYVRDFQLQAISMAAAAALLLHSTIRYYQISLESGVAIARPELHFLWMALFAALLIINLWRVVRPPRVEMTEGLGSWGKAFLAIPLFAYMAINAGIYFLQHGHPSGLAIYINQLMELPAIFLNLGLFIWAGMLLKQSRLVDLCMNVIRPWRFSPELLTYIILLAAAVPTAYTGASGVFVIAAGAIIYHEVRAVGGSRHFALAATAMSGSLGVVLRPCLLVVLIAALNKQVTTNLLYHWGVYVFFLTSTLFFIASQLHRKQRASIESFNVAIPAMFRQMVPLLPYVAVVAAVLFVYEWGLDTKLNEISAPIIVPVMMLILLIVDKMLGRRAVHEPKPEYAAHRKDGVEASIRAATNETTGHIGALLMLMTLSLAMGGVIERSEVMHFFPSTFSSVWTAMAFLVVTKVVLGMIMDPFGAVILVSVTLAPIAYANGIEPVHFWMMVLVAFELGYLLPPVAINQLLTRLVVGEKEIDLADAETRHLGFYRRFERWILPVVVMTVGMVIVAFAPLAVQHWPALAPVKSFFTETMPQ